jgi:chromosome segregation ATPase
MKDNDDFKDIPSLVLAPEDVVERQSARKGSDIQSTPSYGEVIKVSTWPVRIMLFLLTASIGGGAWLGYQAYAENLRTMEQTNRRIEDLESRLALVGDSAEETTANVIERLDFNFSEIDKLWAARNATNNSVNELTGKLTVLEEASKGHTETTETLAQMIANNTEQNQATLGEVNSVKADLEQINTSLAGINTTLRSVQNVAQDMANIRASLNNGDSTLVGLQDRMVNLEEAVESIDAYRLQVNQTLGRLQQNIENLQGGARAAP